LSFNAIQPNSFREAICMATQLNSPSLFEAFQ